ncbi:actin family [Fimicolochytrium jonesii]|uniref:actin family n=1 Tax=Fimicolochytrium jonesii TaxID=1396493 RepID=UPI0022FEADA8|nr:actin family [Fimicolochytrium jonesii]KAI8820591.1 actin family [Fimicolochytrium jonesii]
MTTATYGGDEVSALVFDIGSSTSKVGYAGEDTPKAVYPSWVGYPDDTGAAPMDTDESNNATTGGMVGEDGSEVKAEGEDSAKPKGKKLKPKRFVGETELYPWQPNVELKNPLKEGVVEDWETYEALWDHAFSRLRVDSSEHPLLLSEPSWNPRESREKLIELAFEKYNVPCFYLARNAVLAAFAAGRSTALVLDSGGAMTSAVPVVDGYVLKKAIQKQPFAGNFISDQALLYLDQLGIKVTPQYLVANKQAVDAGQPAKYDLRERPNTRPSYHRLAVERAIDEFKETVCHVSEFQFDETALLQRPVKNYEFPDGYNNIFGIERFKITESMFSPKYVLPDPSQPPEAANLEPISVTRLIQNSINMCDPDLRTLLYPNVVLTGANTLLPGFADRVHSELLIAAPGFKTKIQAAGQTTERRFSPWIGGSILASLGTFHQLWISKQEYEESGVNVEKRLH